MRPKVEVVSVKPVGRLAAGACDLSEAQPRLDGASDPSRNPVLQLENVVGRAVEMLTPDMDSVCRFDQFAGDTYPDTAFLIEPFSR
jgi:hypothetical protein